LVDPERKTTLVEALHERVAMARLVLDGRPWGTHRRGKRWGGRREERGTGPCVDWLSGGRGRMGELHREDSVVLLLFVSCCIVWSQRGRRKHERERRKKKRKEKMKKGKKKCEKFSKHDRFQREN
jgi:hypothetical protein